MTVAVVTGAAGGIGREVCRRLQGRGVDVIAVDLDEARLNELPDPLTRLPLDLTEPDAEQRVLDVVERLGAGCDLLVNNAGIVVTTPLEEVSPADLHREQAVNLLAPMQLTRALYPALQRSRGHVVSVVSLGSMTPLAESPGYSASKAGLRAFMTSLAMRTAQTGVRVSMVHPGSVDTPMLRFEAASGGAAVNFLSEPLDPAVIADAVLGLVDHPRLEVCLPRYDGWLLKAAGLSPSLFPRIGPVLNRLSQPGLRRYRERHGIQ